MLPRVVRAVHSIILSPSECLLPATARISPGWGRALKPWWIGALASGRVTTRSVAATRPPEAVLDTARRQSKLAIKVSRRGLAVGG
jgi:hypothetical protein